MMVALLLAPALLVAQAHAVVLVTEEPGAVMGEAAVSADDVAQAIGVRLTGRDVDVRTAGEGLGERWAVSLAARGTAALAVTIRAPDTRVVRQGTLSFKRRTPSDVASTVAIWVIEALTPVMPELASQRPEIIAAPLGASDSIVDEQFPAREHDYFAARVGIGAQSLMTTNRVLGQLELGVLWLATNAFGVLVSGDVATSFSAESNGASVNVRRGGLVAAGEWRWTLSPATLRVHLGPMLRGLRIGANGGDVAFAHRTYVDPGVQLSLGVSVATTRFLDIGAAARAEHYFAHPALIIDGKAALDTGGTALGFIVWLEPHW